MDELHAWLSEQKRQYPKNDRYSQLPQSARNFGQYVRAYLNEKGLKNHRGQKRVRSKAK